MKRIIITATDDGYAELTLDLLRSLHQWEAPLADAIGVLDVGMSVGTREQIGRYVNTIVEPGWDFDLSPTLREQRPHLRALLARPMLRDYFPGYDRYLWLDSDMWVQERFAVEWYFAAAAHGAMALVPSYDPSYNYHSSHIEWRQSYLSGYFGDDALQLYLTNHYYNAGAFCLGANAIHWTMWADYFRQALSQKPTAVCDQAVLNYMIWKEHPPIYPLPSRCNWLCQYRIPSIQLPEGHYHDPHIPNLPIGIMHLAGRSKNFNINLHNNNQSVDFNLRFESIKNALNTAT